MEETLVPALVKASRDAPAVGSAGSWINNSRELGSRVMNSNNPTDAPRSLHRRAKAA